MKTLYQFLLNKPRTLTLLLASFAALVAHVWATRILNASYAASGFPVPYYEAQLSFSPEKLKEWYAYLAHTGSLDRYVTTQHIDSLFILSTLFLHVLVLTLISRLFAHGTTGRRVLVVCAMASAAAPVSDQLENLVSYAMLWDHAGFPDVWAYVYSSFSALKFAMFAFAYGAAIVGMLAGVFVGSFGPRHGRSVSAVRFPSTDAT